VGRRGLQVARSKFFHPPPGLPLTGDTRCKFDKGHLDALGALNVRAILPHYTLSRLCLPCSMARGPHLVGAKQGLFVDI